MIPSMMAAVPTTAAAVYISSRRLIPSSRGCHDTITLAAAAMARPKVMLPSLGTRAKSSSTTTSKMIDNTRSSSSSLTDFQRVNYIAGLSCWPSAAATSRMSWSTTSSLTRQPCKMLFSSSSSRTAAANPTAAVATTPATTDATTKTKNLPLILRNDNILSVPRKYLWDMSPAQVLGHLAFMLSIYSFSHTDVLDLRTTMLGATLCGTMFQYYRTPIIDNRYRWQLLLFGINAYMAFNLYVERHLAENMNDELKQIYESGDFERRGFSKVEFCKLFRCATRNTIPKDQTLIHQGGTKPNVYILVRGTIQIRQDNRTIATLHQDNDDKVSEKQGHVFLGEMTILDHLRLSEEDLDDDDFVEPAASADVVAGSSSRKNDSTSDDVSGNGGDGDGVVVYEWTYNDMLSLLKKEHEVSNAILAYMCYDLQDKLRLANTNHIVKLKRMMTTKKKNLKDKRKTTKTKETSATKATT